MASYDGYDPATQVPDLTDKVILVTGGTAGIGRTTVLEFARHNPGHIYFTGRNVAAADALIAECAASLPSSRLTFVKCDHASLESVREAAGRFVHTRLDIFIANAGVIDLDNPGQTADGFEVQFGTNHLGNAALLLRLLPVLLRTAETTGDARFVSLSSRMYHQHPREGIRFDTLRTAQADMPRGGWGRYGQSKLANILFTRALGRRYPGLTSVAVHPGNVDTGMVRRLGGLAGLAVRLTRWALFVTEEQGACCTLWAATAADVKAKMEGDQVAFFGPVGRPVKGGEKCRDDELMDKLWRWTEEAVGVKGEAASVGDVTGEKDE